MTIIAYRYEANTYCIRCTVETFYYSTGSGIYDKQTWIDWDFNVPHPASDVNGIHVDQEDSEGEIVRPVFSWDEWQNFDKAYLAKNPTQCLICGDCFKTIDVYTVGDRIKKGGAYSKPAI